MRVIVTAPYDDILLCKLLLQLLCLSYCYSSLWWHSFVWVIVTAPYDDILLWELLLQHLMMSFFESYCYSSLWWYSFVLLQLLMMTFILLCEFFCCYSSLWWHSSVRVIVTAPYDDILLCKVLLQLLMMTFFCVSYCYSSL